MFLSARRMPAIAAAALCVAALSGCSGGRDAVGQALGLNVESPDPFNVVPRAPLRLPSDLSALPPPSPGAQSPVEPRPEETARAALALAGGGPDAGGGTPSPGELGLLEAAGAGAARPGIRETLETERPERERQYGLTSILGYEVPDGSEEDVLEPREAAEEVRGRSASTPTPPPEPEEPPSGTWIIPLGG